MNPKAFDNRKVHVGLSRASQNVAANVTKVGAESICAGRAVRAGNQLTRLNNRPLESKRVEEISGRHVAGGRAWRGARGPVRSRERVITSVQSIEPAGPAVSDVYGKARH